MPLVRSNPSPRAPDPTVPVKKGSDRRLFWLLPILPILVVLGLRARPTDPSPPASRPFRMIDRVISLRDEDILAPVRYLSVPAALMPHFNCAIPRPWLLPGRTQESATEFLSSAIRDPALVAPLVQAMSCDGSGCTIAPSMSVIGALTPEARTRLYVPLSEVDANPQSNALFRRSGRHGPFSETPGLPAVARSLVDRLTWTHGNVRSFSDVAYVCSNLATEEERQAFLSAMMIRDTRDVSLRIDDLAAVDRIVSGFHPPAQETIHERLMEARREGAHTVSLASLMPEWPRGRVQAFPSEAEGWINCYWTAVRFASPWLTSQVHNSQEMTAVLERDFERTEDPRFGDVVVLLDPTGDRIHAANWLLGGYLFTKNGRGSRQPWRTLSWEDMIVDYPNGTRVEFWRQRGARR